MNGCDIQKYDDCQVMLGNLGFSLINKGDSIILYDNEGNLLGFFEDTEQIFNFLRGIVVGKSLVPNQSYWKDRYMKAKDMLKDALMLLPCKTQEHSNFITAIGNEIYNDNNDKG